MHVRTAHWRHKTMKRVLAIVTTSSFLFTIGGCKSNPKSFSEKVELQADVRAMAQRTLDRLYELQSIMRRATQSFVISA